MTRVRKHKTKRSSHQLHKQPVDRQLPFIEHVYELRKRLTYVAISVGVFGAAAYSIEHYIVDILLKPARGQQFIYTSPGGGIDFLFRVCLYVGIICSIPVIIYQILRYIEPLVTKTSVHFIGWGSFVSGILAIVGILYGYFWGLPAALHFLLHQFVTKQIQPLVTIQSYMSFVMVYMVGSALLFQVPLLLIFINRIKPLKPQQLFHYERHVIVAATIISALMNPTPNVFALLFLAGPIILMYQVGIAIIWYMNREAKRSPKIQAMLEKDVEARAERTKRAAQAQPLAKPVRLVAAPIPTALVRPSRSQYTAQVVRRSVQADRARAPRFVSDFRMPGS
ncbi:MAG TPA: twin-arginine translocase subunit TatC [Candidatus Saccharimonadales bacterium]|nr:twin-arginine translocase subunit TatC [Candidatus Saccharimonadales bacterium]